MDIQSALALRELGFGSRFSDLNQILAEKAESALLNSNVVHRNVRFPSDYSKSTYYLVTSPDGRRLASCHGDHNVYVTNVCSGRILHTLSGHPRTPWALAFHPTRSDLLASGCLAGQVRVWDLKTGCCQTLVCENDQAVASLSFHPDSRLLAVAVSNKVLFWDWKDSRPWAQSAARENERVRFVHFNESGSHLYTAITNVETAAERATRQVAPPEIMPSRFHELLRSRTELIEMRAELSNRHEMLQRRYNDLLQRYNHLRQQYPDLAPDSAAAEASRQEEEEAGSENRERLETLPRPRPRLVIPAPSEDLVRPPLLPPSHVRLSRQLSPSPSRQRSFSPIRLERLDDAVGYAHHLTQTSMQQFLEFHQNSMARLQRSYMQLSQSASTLVSNFRRTYDDMYRLQEQIDRRLGLTPADTSYIRPARALLQALTRMQEILMHRAQAGDALSEGGDGRPVERETNTLVELFDSLLNNISDRVPQSISELLRGSRSRVVDIRERSLGISVDEPERLQALNTELTAEIQNFQGIIRQWKTHVVSCLRRQSETSSDSASSSGFVRISLPSDRPTETQASSSGTGSGASAFVVPTRKRGNDDEKTRIGNITISPMKRRSSSQSSEDQPSSSGISQLQGGVNINLSPSRAQPVPSPNSSLTLRLVDPATAVPAAKRRRLHFNNSESTDSGETSGSGRSEAERTAQGESSGTTDAAPEPAGSARTEGVQWRLRPFHRRPRAPTQPDDDAMNDARARNYRWRRLELDQEDSAYDLHRAINRAIAGAFIGTGDVAIANNIMDFTCRIQEWNVEKGMPELTCKNENVLVEKCKLHNDGSLSFSTDGQMLACFTGNLDSAENPVWADTVLQIFSLRSFDKGTLLFQKAFGPNAISVAFSPSDTHVMVGLAARRYLRLRHSPETFAQVYKLCQMDAKQLNQRELKLSLNLNRDLSQLPSGSQDFMALFAMRNCSLNCATWLPFPGQGFAYGTNRGHLYLIEGSDKQREEQVGQEELDELTVTDGGPGNWRRPFVRRQARLDIFDSNQ